MNTLLDSEVEINDQHIFQASQISPIFGDWAETAYLTGDLQIIIGALLQAGEVVSVDDALVWLSELAKDFSPSTYLTLQGWSKVRSSVRSVQELAKQQENNIGLGKRNALAYRFFGSRTHQVFFDWVCGYIDLGQTAHSKIEEIRILWQEIINQLDWTSDWSNNYLTITFVLWSQIENLYALLAEVFGERIERLLYEHKDSAADYFFALTVLSWAAAVIFREDNGVRQPCFKEVRVMNPIWELEGGFIDAVEIFSINGRSPTLKQRQVLWLMAQHKYTSISYLLRVLTREFEAPVAVKLLDLKCSAGDWESGGPVLNRVIRPQDITGGPVSTHRDKIQRYGFLAELDCYLDSEPLVPKLESFLNTALFSDAELVYLFPNQMPISCSIGLGSLDKERFVRARVIARWQNAKERARIRQLTNFLCWNAKRILEGKESTAAPYYPFVSQSSWLLIQNPLAVMIENSRQWLDSNRIIEITGKNKKDKPIYLMFYDKLLAAVDAGKVLTAPSFSRLRGGHISCLGHKERTPSMYVNPQKGVFTCFGQCGIWGWIDPRSIPREIRQRSNYVSLVNPRQGQTRVKRELARSLETAVPDKHHQIMIAAQELFQAAFKGSRAERYFVEQRCLDSDLTFELGAGYADNNAVNGLLDFCSDLDQNTDPYDQLIYYGFISCSPKVSSLQGLVPLLASRGMEPNVIKRQNRRGDWGLPYFRLNQRITFPLELNGRRTNFYGRSTTARKYLTHIKLSTDQTGIPAGGFNIQKALESEKSYVLVVEGVVDALTAIQLGWTPTLAVIGTHNVAIIESIARSENKKVVIGLDRDNAGRSNTNVIAQRLERASFTGQVSDFWETTFAVHATRLEFSYLDDPCCLGEYKDLNQWWQMVCQLKQ